MVRRRKSIRKKLSYSLSRYRRERAANRDFELAASLMPGRPYP
jgi:hypothetical protein